MASGSERMFRLQIHSDNLQAYKPTKEMSLKSVSTHTVFSPTTLPAHLATLYRDYIPLCRDSIPLYRDYMGILFPFSLLMVEAHVTYVLALVFRLPWLFVLSSRKQGYR